MPSATDARQRYRFFLGLTVAPFLVTIAVFALSTDFWLRLATLLVSAAVLYLGYQLASDRSVSANQVRLKVLTFAGAILLPYLRFREELLAALLSAGLPVPHTPLWGETGLDPTSVAIVAAVVIIAALVLFSLRTAPAMGVPENSIEDVLPKVTNLDRLNILKTTLMGHLDQIDSATRWSDANYVPLEAEVQVLEGKTSRRKIVDLQVALRNDQRTRLFVVLGEPGTGKSVALRKLARDLLEESERHSRIPIYINLKEWRTETPWTIQSPPTIESFYHFLLHNVLQSLDFNSQSFLQENQNFKRLFEAGYFFLILDSFDEIPAVLDHDENSWLVESLSNCIVTCVLGGLSSRAVIASRLFRKPKIANQDRSVFEIRPFSDSRIVTAVQSAANESARLMRIIFSERQDLGILARNPFLLHLIVSHFNTTGQPPLAQAEMFESFIQSNVKLAKKTFGFNKLTDEEIYQICETISTTMFDNPNVGLEITDVELKREIDSPLLPDVIRFLTQARIGRIGATSGAFSFAHRRFNEYFLVRSLSFSRSSIPYDAIQTDSRWRDALVLFAEIAPAPEATKLAEHAWAFAQQLAHYSLATARPRFIEARNALRFLIEGFRNRPDLIASIREPIASLVEQKLDVTVDYIEIKTVTEALSIVPIQTSYKLILKILYEFPGWISEQAASAARYLPRIDRELAVALYRYCIIRPGLEGLREARRNEPIFAISEAFSLPAKWLWWYRFDFYKLAAACLVACNLKWMIYYRLIVVIVISILLCVTLVPPVLRFVFSVSTGLRDNFKFEKLYENAYREDFRHYMVAFLILVNIDTYMQVASGAPSHWSDYQSLLVALECVVLVIGIVPFSPKVWQDVFNVATRHRTRVFVGVGLVAVAIALATAAIFGINYLTAAIPEIEIVFVMMGLIGFGVIFVIPALKGLWNHMGDWWRYRKILRSGFTPVRSVIAQQFLSLKTSYFRMLLVGWFEVSAIDCLIQLRREGNEWPDGRRPQMRGDGSSVKLAELDARWLGLD
jgi:NACHT domain-containing protein